MRELVSLAITLVDSVLMDYSYQHGLEVHLITIHII
nr:MAG TPA_asm: hypothetical protein [Caudoviricetes sp.]